MPDIRVLLIEPDDERRTVLREMIQQQSGYMLIADSASSRQGIELVEQHQPDLVLINPAPNDMAVSDVVRLIKELLPNTRIIVYSPMLGSLLEAAGNMNISMTEISNLMQAGIQPSDIIAYSADNPASLFDSVNVPTPKPSEQNLSPDRRLSSTDKKKREDEDNLTTGASEIITEETEEEGEADEKADEVDGFIDFEDLEPEPTPEELQTTTQEMVVISTDQPAQPSIAPPGSVTQEIPVPQTRPVQFSAYYPRDVLPNARYGMIVYAHTAVALDAIEKDVSKFSEELGGEVQSPKTAKQIPELADNIPVTIIPESDELTFDPPSLTKIWGGTWTRYNFDLVADRKFADETAFVRVSIQVGGVEIAYIKLAVDVRSSSGAGLPTLEKIDNPLARAKLSTRPAQYYNKIFISYSRRDKQVANGYRLAQIAAGHDVFMDSYSIRSGENWQAALANAIDSADIFQLFWSQHTADSKNCRDEWEYALLHKCPDDKCVHFIRPVYWQKPLVSPPEELGHINFRFVPFEPES